VVFEMISSSIMPVAAHPLGLLTLAAAESDMLAIIGA
jgi:hypothetical protein